MIYLLFIIIHLVIHLVNMRPWHIQWVYVNHQPQGTHLSELACGSHSGKATWDVKRRKYQRVFKDLDDVNGQILLIYTNRSKGISNYTCHPQVKGRTWYECVNFLWLCMYMQNKLLRCHHCLSCGEYQCIEIDMQRNWCHSTYVIYIYHPKESAKT